MRKIVIITLALLLLPSLCWGSVGVKQDGVMKGIATDLDIKGGNVTSDGSTVTIGVNGSPVTEVTTYTTLTVADSGTTYLSSGTTYSTTRRFALPVITNADDGIWFRFITNGLEGAGTDTNAKVKIHPNGELKIYCTTTPTAGYNIESTVGTTTTLGLASAVSYPTITLQAKNGGWYAVSTTGQWALGTTDN